MTKQERDEIRDDLDEHEPWTFDDFMDVEMHEIINGSFAENRKNIYVLLNELGETEADRDRWRARAEAMEREYL